MSIHETEAAKAWCPFSRLRWAKPDEDCEWRTTSDPGGAFNRVRLPSKGQEMSLGLCIGSRCMAWRTTGSHQVGRDVKLVGLELAVVTNIVERVGYCGLAGTPGLSDSEMLS